MSLKSILDVAGDIGNCSIYDSDCDVLQTAAFIFSHNETL